MFKEPIENPKVQTAKSPEIAVRTKLGRPRGKKSDPNYRQVTIYLPIDLHETGKEKVFQAQLSRNKAVTLDFSEIVEQALRLYFQSFESPKVPKVESRQIARTLEKPEAQELLELVALPAENRDADDQSTVPQEESDDEQYQRDSAKIVANFDQWLTGGKITPAERRRLLALYHKDKNADEPELTSKEIAWINTVTQRANASNK